MPEPAAYLGADFGHRTAAAVLVDPRGEPQWALYLRERTRGRKRVPFSGGYSLGPGGTWRGAEAQVTGLTEFLRGLTIMLTETTARVGAILPCIEKAYVAVQVPASRTPRRAHTRSIDKGQLRGITAQGAMKHAIALGCGLDEAGVIEVMKSTRSNPSWQTLPQREGDKVLAPILAAGAEPGGDHLSDAARIALWCRRYGAHMRARRA